eukprot:TRINITY_DN12144_c0_g1_i1.p1 TRINITY_DN12144_c0_g1~~TRINITY_DN12144_c0_g1_i1.p1  ORF type:complete len:489 (+),score=155.08 TRINITY_DN12144_c0_g1_i1:200-1666(+)
MTRYTQLEVEDDDDERMEMVTGREDEGSEGGDAVAVRGSVTGLYFAHFLGTFGDRMWQFAIPYLFSKLWEKSMEPVAVFCLLLYASTFGGMFYLGNWMDHTDRLSIVRTTIVLEACAVLASVLFFWLLLVVGAHDNMSGANQDLQFTWQTIVSYIGLLITAVLAEIMARGGTIAMERDWVVVISQGDSDYQAHLNSWMRRIDLLCKLGGPLIFMLIDKLLTETYGDDQSHVQFKYGIAIVGAWNVISVPLELKAVQGIYEMYPKLAEKKQKADDARSGSVNPMVIIYHGAREYWNHPVRWASIAYCQLWFTVLDNGSLMTSYLVWARVNDFVNVASRGVGALFGILGTFAFPYILKASPSLERAGTYSIVAFSAFISVVGVVFLVSSFQVSAYVMVVGVVLSRSPLWSFDLAIQQILQEKVEEESRGTINGVHSALCQLQMMCVYVVALIFAHSYEQFYILALFSVASVSAAALMYVHWAQNIAHQHV